MIKCLHVSFSLSLVAKWRLPSPLRPCYEYSFSCLSNKVALIQPWLDSGRGEERVEEGNTLSFNSPGSHSDPLEVPDPSHLWRKPWQVCWAPDSTLKFKKWEWGEWEEDFGSNLILKLLAYGNQCGHMDATADQDGQRSKQKKVSSCC